MAEHGETDYGSLGTTLEPLLDIRSAATYLGISRAGIYRLIGDGQLEPVRVGSRSRFDPADLRAFVEQRKVRAVA